MRFVALRRVIQPELLVFKQVAVVGQERDSARHFQRAFPLELEITNGIEGVGEVARFFQLTADFYRLPPRHLVGYWQVSTVKGYDCWMSMSSSHDTSVSDMAANRQSANALKIDVLLFLLFSMFIVF